jgi:ferredoxin
VRRNATRKEDCRIGSRFVKREAMADKNSKQPLNVPGAWYVDTTCTMCRTCLEEAPNLLKVTEDETAVYFVKQPEGDAETAAAQRAMEVCPTLAIGNDG